MIREEVIERRIYDLGAAARALSAEAKFARFVFLTKQFGDALSAEHDLQMAKTAIELCVRYTSKPTSREVIPADDPDRETIAAALFTRALLQYCRATGGNNDNRPQLPITKKWVKEHREAHQRLHATRSKAIAHFGYFDENPDGAWAADTVVAVVENDMSRLTGRHGRANYRGVLIHELMTLIPIALAAVFKLADARGHDLSVELQRFRDNDPASFKQINSFPFDGSTFGNGALPITHDGDYLQINLKAPSRKPFEI